MHRQLSLLVFVPALVATAFSFSSLASAAAQRTFVASFGSPTNVAFNCSITKPCRAFSEAIGVTNPKGEVVVLDSAGYGPVTITQSVSIIAPPGIYAGISVFSGNDGVTVNAGASDIVVLRGLSINGQGGNRGIFFQAGARLRVENCVISGMGMAGILHSAPSGELIVLETIVRDNTGSGIVVVGDVPSAVLDHVRSEHNGGDGLTVAPTAGSLGVLVTAVDSVFAHNEGKGIGGDTVSGSTLTMLVERSVMSYNGQDGFVVVGENGATAAATLTRNAINDNGGNGVWLQGNTSGTVSENTMHRNGGNGFRAVGDTFVIQVGANSAAANLGTRDWWCDGFGSIFSGGNNLAATNHLFCSYSFPTGI